MNPPFSDEKTTVDPVFYKLNYQIVVFGNDVSEHRRVSTTMNLASNMMPDFLTSNGEKMPPVWFERDYRLTSAFYKDVLETKVLPWVKKITKKSDYVSQQDLAPAYNAESAED